MKKPEIYEKDIVKWEIMKHFGAFVSESSIHNSEYMPYFRRTPELIDRYTSDQHVGRGQKGRDRRGALCPLRRAAPPPRMSRTSAGPRARSRVPVERSHEYGSRILNAIETNVPYIFNGNVHNTGLITNLLPNAIVEVPIMADAMGLHPCHVGDLPPALAALNRSNLAVQELAVKGFVEKDRESHLPRRAARPADDDDAHPARDPPDGGRDVRGGPAIHHGALNGLVRD